MHSKSLIARWRCARKAAALFKKFNEVFWNEELGFYAYLLDGEKRTGSDHHLQCRAFVVVRHRTAGSGARVVARLMAPNMNTGWGIRTLSSRAWCV
jgi:glycogen debranching enzyme